MTTTNVDDGEKGGGGGGGISPKKVGILMTPGTAAANARRKTVSFPAGVKGSGGGGRVGGDVVLDGEALFGSQTHAQTPKDLPGKFPSPSTSPWMRKSGGAATGQDRRASRRRVRDSGAEKDKVADCGDGTLELSSPRSRSGRYWKGEYEAYDGNATVEMRRLVKKEHLAKKFARVMDAEAAALREELRVERRRVGELRMRIGEVSVDVEGEVCEVVDIESPGVVRERMERAEGSVEVLRREKRVLELEVERLHGEKDKAVKELQEECGRLKRENEKLRSEKGRDGSGASQKEAKHTPRPRKPRERFDIWADVAGLEEEESLPALDGSSPLKTRELNEVVQSRAESQETAHQAKKSTSTKAAETKKVLSAKEERLAAARLRLEEKRKNREKNPA